MNIAPDIVDTISVVKPPRKQANQPILVTQELVRQEGRWETALREALHIYGRELNARRYLTQQVEITDELPTDVLTYFVNALDASIAPEIATVLLDGRVHFVVVLSLEEPPQSTEAWHLPLRASKERGILCPLEGDDYTTRSLLHFSQVHTFTTDRLHELVGELIARKGEYDM